jgi:hypothetical protein
MRRLLAPLLVTLAAPAAFAQVIGGASATPILVDLKKVPVGAWASYDTKAAGMEMKTRWALVARDAKANTMEMAMEGGPMAMMGGKMAVRMVLAPDPTAVEKPVKQVIVQMGERDPMEMPLDMPNMPAQKFSKPDPKKLVGKEQVKVPAGTFATKHYREVNDKATIDAWMSEDVPPFGIVKVNVVPKPGATAPNGQQIPPVTMELAARGADAKPTITKPAKPFDPRMLMGGPPAGPPPGAPPAAGPPAK